MVYGIRFLIFCTGPPILRAMLNKNPDFAIVGTGAVGGYYGGLLQKAGFGVHFLLHSDYDAVRRQGLRIESPGNDFHLPQVNAHIHPADMPRCDVVVVALKTTANAALPGILPHLLRPGGFVLTLQNGLGSEEEMARHVGNDAVVGGLCFLCSNKVGPGHIRHLDYGLITLGEYRSDGSPGGLTPRLETLAGKLKSAGISIQLIEDLALARWKKLVWNIPFNGLSVVRNALTDALVTHPESRALCQTLMDETAAAAAASNAGRSEPVRRASSSRATPRYHPLRLTNSMSTKPAASRAARYLAGEAIPKSSASAAM